LWHDLNTTAYCEKSIAGEIGISVLLDLNNVEKPQLEHRSGHFIACTALNPVLLRYVVKQFLRSFTGFLDQSQLKCKHS
jgi:hypothetical protein